MPAAGTGNNNNGYEGKHEIGTDSDTPVTLMQMGDRVYDPLTGRFLQIDPIIAGSANSYDYVDQDPLNDSDPGGYASARVKIYCILTAGLSFCGTTLGLGKGHIQSPGPLTRPPYVGRPVSGPNWKPPKSKPKIKIKIKW